MSSTRPDIDVHPKGLSPVDLKVKEFDVVIIGGGPSGETAAVYSVKGRLTALLIESELVGGECPYWACVPSKAMLRPNETIESVKAVGGAKERLALLAAKYGATPQIDIEGTWSARDRFTKGWKDDANVQLMRTSGVEVVRGFGSIAGEKRVSIKEWHSGSTVEVTARRAVVVATGSAPSIPDIAGLEKAGYWTPREAVSSNEVPEHLIIIGGGVVGCEMAFAYRSLGSQVTIIGGSDRLLPKMVPEASSMIKLSMNNSGIEVLLSTTAKEVTREGSTVKVDFVDGTSLQGSEILVAAGRRARTAGMELDKVGAPTDGATIIVDESLRVVTVQAGWLYAVGDPNGLAPLTHMGRYQAIVASQSIIARARGATGDNCKESDYSRRSRKPSDNAKPQVVFTDPQIASVGMTVEQAQAQGLKVKAHSVKMQGPGTFLHAADYDGWGQWIVAEGTGQVLGATFVGRDVADLLHASTVAVVGKLSWRTMFHAVPSFPTLGEVYHNLVESCAK